MRLAFLVLAAAFVLGPVSGLVAGCERAAGDPERERAIAEEQKAITAYSEKVGEVDKLQARFSEEWRKANEIKDLKAFQSAIEAQVIPALEAYLAALKVMPAGSKTLAEVHGVVVQAYEGGVAAFKAFVDGLHDDNVEERYKVLLQAMDQVAKAEKSYQERLGDYYAQNRVKLVATKGDAESE